MAVQETIVLNVQTKGLKAVEDRISRIQNGADKLAKQQKFNKALTTEQLIARKIAEIEGLITKENRKQVSEQNKVNQGKKKELGLTERIAKAGRSKRLAAATIGGAFPILFGGGPGSSIGGAIGGFAGGPGAGGFAGSLAGSILGGIIDKTVAKSAELGAALNPLTADMQALVTATGESQSEFGRLILQLEQLGEAERALELITERVAQIVGQDGVDSLKNFDDQVVILKDQVNKAVTALSAMASVLAGPLITAINGVLKQFNAMQMYESQLRNDPEFAKAEEAKLKLRTETQLEKNATINSLKDGGLTKDGEMLLQRFENQFTFNNETRRQYIKLSEEAYEKRMKLNKAEEKGLKIEVAAIQAKKDAERSSGGGGSTAAKTDRKAQLVAEVEYNRAMLALKQQYVPLLGEEGRLYEKQLREKQIALQLDKDIEKINAGTSKNKALEILNKQLQAKGKLQDMENKEALLMTVRQENYEKLIERLDLELRIKKAVTEEQRKQLEIEKKMLALQGEFDEKQQEKIKEKLEALEEADKGGKLKKYMEDLQASLDDVEGQIVSLLQTIETEFASAMSNAIYGVITGTSTVEEAFSEMFANIGKAFIDMATQMIAKALILKVLGVLMPGGTVSAGQVADAHGGAIALPTGFADGGYVTGPTNALIGEGGDSEYVIPSQKMGEAMERYSGGMRGDAVIPSSGDSGGGMGGSGADLSTAINISGGVLNFNDESYIKQDQIPVIINQASKSGEARTLSRLRSSSATRRRVGMA